MKGKQERKRLGRPPGKHGGPAYRGVTAWIRRDRSQPAAGRANGQAGLVWLFASGRIP